MMKHISSVLQKHQFLSSSCGSCVQAFGGISSMPTCTKRPGKSSKTSVSTAARKRYVTAAWTFSTLPRKPLSFSKKFGFFWEKNLFFSFFLGPCFFLVVFVQEIAWKEQIQGTSIWTKSWTKKTKTKSSLNKHVPALHTTGCTFFLDTFWQLRQGLNGGIAITRNINLWDHGDATLLGILHNFPHILMAVEASIPRYSWIRDRFIKKSAKDCKSKQQNDKNTSWSALEHPQLLVKHI